ncbi:MAG: hypothetical protein KAV87_08790 [Desulfobacteraceae bacterium]|nr:hypothetical protein [Desulfobacteraceae bacterium]
MERLLLREEDFYEMLSFLVSSAYLMAQGEENEELYPSLRLIDAAKRLAKYALASGGLENEVWVILFSVECEKGLNLMEIDKPAFTDFLSDSTFMLAKEMKRREDVS